MEIHARHYATGKPITVRADRGNIASITQGVTQNESRLIAPGLVDLQINGYAGRDFNRLPILEGTVGEAVRLLWREGVTSFYPTFITNSPEAVEQAMTSIARACDADPVAEAGIAGIHVEGPFISPEDGARGAHARQFVRPPDWDLFRRWQDASGDRIRIITMSPEWPDSSAFIERCAASGVTVSIGHTAATADQVADAVRAGARMVTHLGNGAHLMLPRHPNYIWEQLAQDELSTCLIADGFHLPDQVIKVAMRVKGERAILVSDAVSLAGMPPGTYSMPVGGDVVLTPSGRLHLSANEKLLAGSAQMLLWGIEHLLRRGLASLQEAWEMSSIRASALMHLPAAAGLSVGAPADLVTFRRDGDRVVVEQTYKGGEIVYDRSAHA